MLVLGIESSCDETGVALYDTERGLLAHHLHTQMAMHAEYGGVVPELASRDHIRRVVPLTQGCLQEAGVSYDDIDAVAYTQGPGLGGALLAGSGYANALAFALNKPVIPIHHLEGHLLSPLLADDKPEFPFVALLVSGGHTQFMAVRGIGDYTLMGESVDDAAGEAFDKTAKLFLVSREDGVIAGMDLARLAFQTMDPSVRFQAEIHDGQTVRAGQTLAAVEGNARALLAAERTALNYLTHLSGIATATARAVAEVAEYDTDIVCSRKTIPLLRVLQKYAVRAGGGVNHRMGLDDAVLIKDNHLAYCDSIAQAVRQAKQAVGPLTCVEIEVDTLAQLDEAIAAGAERILLDNMDDETLKEATNRCHTQTTHPHTIYCEASGGIGFDRLKRVAQTGVDGIALGYLTHSSRSLDIGLDFVA